MTDRTDQPVPGESIQGFLELALARGHYPARWMVANYRASLRERAQDRDTAEGVRV